MDDLVDFTPAIHQEAVNILDDYTYGPLFTPPSVSVPGGNRGTILRPSAGGGANWMGAAVDPESSVIYIPSSDSISVPVVVETNPEESSLRYRRISYGGTRGPKGLPLLKPPYSTITAIDMNEGEILWQVPNGARAPNVENNPALEGIDLPPLGGGGRNPIVATPNMLIHAQNYQDGPLLIARDKTTGAQLGSIKMPARAIAAPITYQIMDNQYLVVAVLTEPAPQLVAWKLP